MKRRNPVSGQAIFEFGSTSQLINFLERKISDHACMFAMFSSNNPIVVKGSETKITKLLAKFINLQSLNLNIRDPQFCTLPFAELVSSFKYLTNLQLQTDNILSTTLIINNLTSDHEIRALALGDYDATNSEINILFSSVLRNCPKLEYLMTTQENFEINNLNEAAESISRLQNLNTLIIKDSFAFGCLEILPNIFKDNLEEFVVIASEHSTLSEEATPVLLKTNPDMFTNLQQAISAHPNITTKSLDPILQHIPTEDQHLLGAYESNSFDEINTSGLTDSADESSYSY